MARTRGPLLSAEARGKFGNTILFQNNAGRSSARMMFKPKNKKTVFQQSNRSNITFGVNLWQTLDAFTKFIWEFVKDEKQLAMSGYNFFLSEYNTSRTSGQPIKYYPDSNLFMTYPIPNNLVSWWRFDEAIGNVANDSVGTNTGTIIGATYVNGKINKALSFNMINDYVNTGLRLSVWPVKTFEGWFYFTNDCLTLTDRAMILHAGAYDSNKYCGLRTYVGKIRFCQGRTDAPGNFYIETYSVITANVWHHIVGIIDKVNGYLKLYIDGVLVRESDPAIKTEIQNSAFYQNNINGVGIGGNPLSRYFGGIIDEVKIYNRALTQVEILHNYNLHS